MYPDEGPPEGSPGYLNETKIAETKAENQKQRESYLADLMTGEFDYLRRVVVPDLEAYEHFLLEHLTRIKGIASIKSSFSLKQVCYKTTLPLPQ